MNTPVLEVKNLEKKYISKRFGLRENQIFPAVNNISFQLFEGETLGLVGESGCGKSTTAKMIVRLLEPDSGQILLKGQDIQKIPVRQFRHIRTQIQLIQQNPFGCMDPRMKMIDTLSEGILTHHIPLSGLSIREYLAEILSDCDLPESYLDRYPNEFSGGQLQRLAIARAIALKPSIVLADEIVSALDISVQSQILDLLMKLKEEQKMSVIFISHDLSVVRRISDRILVMKEGEIIDSGTTDYIFEHSENPYTIALKSAIIPFLY